MNKTKTACEQVRAAYTLFFVMAPLILHLISTHHQAVIFGKTAHANRALQKGIRDIFSARFALLRKGQGGFVPFIDKDEKNSKNILNLNENQKVFRYNR